MFLRNDQPRVPWNSLRQSKLSTRLYLSTEVSFIHLIYVYQAILLYRKKIV
ncbi:hypothetical protein PanWU01x14_017650 [Parasponia andersonii]|uniref:Uncharacterized protein n=1 Tax=Parasponia andersonii TaxID=3476 RepID=A0A2P5DZ06_PARAD|nr:hypothetical protein PanWU01x14_017650 [Parasponia andersonii]